jgi:cobyrinic acid a,c-diamide synthase
VVLNRVGTPRQEKVIREAIANATGLSVLGAIPRLRDQHLPSRHLGLVPAAEHPQVEQAIESVACAVANHVDLDRVLTLAGSAPALEASGPLFGPAPDAPRTRIGVLRDEAFSFYYPENLEALEAAGGEVVPLSPQTDDGMPAIDALYAGGGFPECHAAGLSANRAFREALAERIAEGLPVWAECGGLMYLSRELTEEGTSYPMVGALPIRVERTPRPQGHGYVSARVDRQNPFLDPGTELRGHEFHYSRLLDNGDRVDTVLSLDRGTGVGKGRDGLQVGNVVASYTHLHALGAPTWAPSLVEAAQRGGC